MRVIYLIRVFDLPLWLYAKGGRELLNPKTATAPVPSIIRIVVTNSYYGSYYK